MKSWVVIIEGATAVGKSALALALAEELSSELISADSRQVYRYMDIGTAKSSPADKARVRHHLIDVITPDELYDAGRFAREAGELIQQMHKAGKIPVIAGGTGFYIKTLMEGISTLPPVPEAIRQKLEAELSESSSSAMYQRLKEIDTVAATRTHPNDRNRVLRALEVFEATGIPISRHWENKPTPPDYITIRILLNQARENLYDKINRRMDTMLAIGLLDEIASLLEMGFNNSCPGMKTLGYREFLPYLSGVTQLAECVDTAKQNSRHYAKRQLTWYRKQNFDLTFDTEKISLSNVISEILMRLK
ncbi:MAG: tRNA (adenosine(37)-N6)-dimethylallyltransferase MiaA [Candidatus Cloacimonetes bacterium]|nr:tRNA (adenosine(37)-N6)-dimethylallyltransferase MiaA [Candidatus Cloacimonadota bacterium]